MIWRARPSAGSPGSTPQRLPPMLTSTWTGRVIPASPAASSSAMTCAGSSAQLLAADDFVGDENVLDPAIDHRLGFADLLAAHADRAQLHLLERDHGTFVCLGVRAQSHRAAGALRQPLEIALEGVEIDDQRRRVDLVERHADLGGRTGGHWAKL